MAVRAITRTDLPKSVVYAWTGLTNATSDSGVPLELVEFGDASIQFTGTFGAGGTIILEGSNDGTNYATLADPNGNAISKTAAGIEQILEAVRYIRPRVTAGDGTTSLTATLFARRALR